MLVLITGGSGFLGSHVAEELVRLGHQVRCLVRKSSDRKFLESLGVEFVVGAVDQADTLPDAVRGVEAIVHSAGLVKARTEVEFAAVHVDGTRDLALAAIAHAPHLRRFVHVSTAAVMGPGREGKKLSIKDAPNPQTRYARTKLAGERALLELRDRLPLTIIRPPAIYGPRDNEILAFFKMIRRSRLAIRMGDSLRTVSMVYGPDAAAACVRAIFADVPSGSTYLIDDGAPQSFESMAQAIADAYKVKILARPRLPRALVHAAAVASDLYSSALDRAVMFNTDKLGELLMEHFVVDSEPARRELGWAPQTDFQSGAAVTAEWYRANRWD